MSRKHPHFKPAMDNRTWSEICKDVDVYYRTHKKTKANGYNKAGGANMSEFQKLTNLQSRIKKGAALKQTSHDGGNYVVHLTTDPPIVFGAEAEDKVDRILHDLSQI
jgi:hypothetical protein